MCFSPAKPKAPPAPPPPVTQSNQQVLDASDQARKAAALRKGQNNTLFAGATPPTNAAAQLGQGQAGGQQLKSLLG